MNILLTESHSIGGQLMRMMSSTRPGFRLDPPDNPPKAVVIDNKTNKVIKELIPEKVTPFMVDIYA